MQIRSTGMYIWLEKMDWLHIAIKLKVVEYFWSMETHWHKSISTMFPTLKKLREDLPKISVIDRVSVRDGTVRSGTARWKMPILNIFISRSRKNVMPFFKNKPTINHEEFHFFDFNGSKCRLDRQGLLTTILLIAAKQYCFYLAMAVKNCLRCK